MKESAALHRLIHSLTKNEKRYFNLFASTHRDSSDYLKIFKAISEQENYDESKLITQLTRERNIPHFAVKKNQLYRLLLRALRTYHEGRTFDTTLKEMMLNASILSDKALYRDCYAILQHAKELAWDYEDWKTLLEILHRSYTILNQLPDIGQPEKEAEKISREEDTILEQMNNYGLMSKLTIHLNLLLKNSSAENKNAVEDLIHHPILTSEKNAISFRSKSLYYVVWSNYLIHARQLSMATGFLRKHIELYEKFPQFIEASPGNYLGTLKDLLEVNFRLKRFDKAKKLIEQLRHLPEDSEVKKIGSKRFRQLIFSWTFKIEISIAVQTENFHPLKSFFSEKEEYFTRIEKTIEPQNRLETRSALASFYFFSGDNKKCIYNLQKIFSDKEVSRFASIHLQGLIMHWLIHFDEGNHDLLDYLLSPILRLSQSMSGLAKTHQHMIGFIVKATNENDWKQVRSLKIFYDKKFQKLKKSAAESHLYDYFDLTLWLKKGK